MYEVILTTNSNSNPNYLSVYNSWQVETVAIKLMHLQVVIISGGHKIRHGRYGNVSASM